MWLLLDIEEGHFFLSPTRDPVKVVPVVAAFVKSESGRRERKTISLCVPLSIILNVCG